LSLCSVYCLKGEVGLERHEIHWPVARLVTVNSTILTDSIVKKVV
jgi:hypothetical protein